MNPRELLNAVAALLWPLAERAVTDAADPLGLSGLGDDPTAPPELQGRLLQPVNAVPGERGGLMAFLRSVVGDLGPGRPLRLHGWRRPDGQRGLALVARQGDVCAALAVVPGGPQLDVVVTGRLRVEHENGPWGLEVLASGFSGAWDLTVVPGAPPTVRTPDASGSMRVLLFRSLPVRSGPPGLAVDKIVAQLDVDVAAAAPQLSVELKGFSVAVVPDDLSGLLGPLMTAPAGLQIVADRAGGLRFAGTGATGIQLRHGVRLGPASGGGRAVPGASPGVDVLQQGIELRLAGQDLVIGARVSVAVRPRGLPLRAGVARIGLDLPIALAGDRVGPLPDRCALVGPDGLHVDLDVGPVSGGGALQRTGPGAYGGVLDLDLAALSVKAVGRLRPPSGNVPMSFLLLLSASFPPPGIQVGLGFAVDAVGGIVGIGHRADADALRRMVADGHADRVLFPDDPARRAGEIIDALGAAFPEARGRFVVGPMLRITWSGGIVSLAAAVILDLPAPPQFLLLGRMLAVLPHKEAPIVHLQAELYGRVDPGVPSVELLVSLTGSWIAGVPVSGDIYLLFRGEGERGGGADFVLSAGGFHPRYVRPPGVPELDRLRLALGGGLGLRAEAYFAVTSNAVMFGGQVRLEATIAGCGVEGWLGLDTLFVFDPVFSFSARVFAGVAVKVLGERLAGVALDFTLEGPAPWHAFGTGSVSVLFEDISLDFDVTWGSKPAVAPPPVDPDLPARRLGEAFAKREAWSARAPVRDRTGLWLTADAKARVADGELIHPDSVLCARQSVLPLNVTFDRFQRMPIPPQRWRPFFASLGGTAVENPNPVTDRFVPAEFFTMTEDERLGGEAFREFVSGLEFSADPSAAALDAPRRAADGYETGYRPERPPHLSLHAVDLMAEAFARRWDAAERVERWRRAEPLVRLA
ncbi:hypothetical protein E1287_05025 [Actinomadura sp. KC06]|uniref:DUF6603 domain-containing protein n=1 Tax=Actinomadura sp. KC06 TaxID=2530369 RepID=UPI0010456CC0|nr:DUF6603 domain-containing protein [Actinomadura sp. KC06]TDD38647.1 hypothetical protein E1287_05025 [Actinomadura sp. KC06]